MNQAGDDSDAEGRRRSASQPRNTEDAGDSHPQSDDPTIDVAAMRREWRIESSNVKIGDRIGRYEVTGVLGVGGMGVVFRAHDTAIDRTVAIKVLTANVGPDSKALDRFFVEARAAGKLNHPNAVPIYEIGESAGIHYLVMEYAPGGSVAARIEKDGAFSAVEATRIAADAARGLAAAHKAGVIHRDMKPANLLVSHDGTIKIADFGLAKPALSEDRQLTAQGQILGTPYFMSPEQCEAGELDHRSDIYSLGATYYALLAGVNPYQSEGSFVRVMHAHCAGEVLDPRKRNRAIPEACARIVSRAAQKRPEDRYQSADEMIADLDTVLATLSGASGIRLPSDSRLSRSVGGPAEPIRRRALAAGILLLIGVIGGAAVWRGRTISPGSTGDGGRSRNGVAPVVAAAGEPIKVGVLNSLTGTMAVSGASAIEATLLAIEEVNAAGGVLGRPLEAVVRDTRSETSEFAPEAERLIVDDRVSVIFGCWTSSGRKSVVPVVERHNCLLIYPRLYEGVEESPNVFYLGGTPNQQMLPAVNWAHEDLKRKRFFLVGSDYVFPRIANEIIKDALRELGAEVVGEEYRPLGSDDFQPVVDKIVAAKPDCIMNTISGDSNIEFVQQLRAAGVQSTDTPTISFSIGEEELLQVDIEKMVGDFSASGYFQSIESPENERFVAAFRKKFGPQRVVTDPMEAAFMSVNLWAGAVQEAGSLETAAVRQAMRSLPLPSPAGGLRIDPSTQHAYKTPRIGRITESGQFEIVWEAPEPVSPEPYAASRSAESWRALLHDLQRSWNGQWAAPDD